MNLFRLLHQFEVDEETGGRLHGPQRRIYRNVRAELSDASLFLLFKIALNEMNGKF